MRAGLIPSRALQEKRIVHDRGLKKDEDEGEFSTADFCYLLATADFNAKQTQAKGWGKNISFTKKSCVLQTA